MVRTDRSLTRDLPCEANAASRARALVDVASLRFPEDVRLTARLLVTELVANAVRHSGLGAHDVVRLEIDVGASALRVAVSDAGMGFVARGRPALDDEGRGFGMMLLTALADASGVESSVSGTRAWFELRGRPRRRRAPPGGAGRPRLADRAP